MHTTMPYVEDMLHKEIHRARKPLMSFRSVCSMLFSTNVSKDYTENIISLMLCLAISNHIAYN